MLSLSRVSVTCLLGVLRSSSELSRASVTCLLDVELGVEKCFFGVKGVGDVLAGFDVELGVVFSGVKGVDDVLAGREQGLTCSLVSRASMTCLLGVEQGLDVFFGFTGVDDVLAGVEQGVYGGVYGVLAVDGFFSRSSGSSRS